MRLVLSATVRVEKVVDIGCEFSQDFLERHLRDLMDEPVGAFLKEDVKIELNFEDVH